MMRFLCLVACCLTVFPKIHLYKTDKGDTRNLCCLTNDDCAPIRGIDSTILSHMKVYGIKGASLAVMRGDSLLYAKGYGYADVQGEIPMQPSNIMRIASVSKLVTAVGIMKLQEEGKLRLSDKVFTPDGGLLGSEPYTAAIRDMRVFKITVEHLLRHQGGFVSGRGDPMFGLDLTSSGKQILERVLSRPLGFEPGTSQDYSNVGFYILSLIIEKVTGQSYEDWMQANVLHPCQCNNFKIAGNTVAERHPGEVKYYMQPGAEPDKCYTSNNITRLSGAGAWVASAPELCRLIAAIDNDWGINDLLGRMSIEQMTRFISPEIYSLGWNDTNAEGIWTRTGSFAGTTAIIKYFSHDGDCWVLTTNSSTCYGAHMGKRNSALIRRMRSKYLKLLPKKDLFHF